MCVRFIVNQSPCPSHVHTTFKFHIVALSESLHYEWTMCTQAEWDSLVKFLDFLHGQRVSRHMYICSCKGHNIKTSKVMVCQLHLEVISFLVVFFCNKVKWQISVCQHFIEFRWETCQSADCTSRIKTKFKCCKVSSLRFRKQQDFFTTFPMLAFSLFSVVVHQYPPRCACNRSLTGNFHLSLYG